jgi:hypothetical protein
VGPMHHDLVATWNVESSDETLSLSVSLCLSDDHQLKAGELQRLRDPICNRQQKL